MGHIKTLKDIFDRTIQKPNGCIEWTGGTNGHGLHGRYGQVRYNGRRYTVHILVLLLSGYEIPDGKFVCHKCDNPICCNPDHLFIGTPKENINDAQAKGRFPVKKPKVPKPRKTAQHGSKAMYTLHGCRCELCTAANTEYIRSYRKKKTVTNSLRATS